MRWFGKAALMALALSWATSANAEDLFANIKSGKPEPIRPNHTPNGASVGLRRAMTANLVSRIAV
jgi:hypothetical protein